MCKDFREGDSVVVNYPHGGSRAGTFIERNEAGACCVVYDNNRGAEECDRNVKESWIEIPGQHLQMTASA